jgi:hypothetical protein
MYDETNTKTNLPAQIDLYATPGSDYNFLFMAKGGGSANKTYLYQVLCAPGHCDTMIGASLASSSSYSKLVCILCSTANQGAAEQGVAHEVPRGQYQDHVCHPYQLISNHARVCSVLTLCAAVLFVSCSGTSACPPYHLAIVIGDLSAELTLKTVKMASAKYLDNLPTSGLCVTTGYDYEKITRNHC